MTDTDARIHDVLIVGGGPVGLTLALALAARGCDVAVAEASPPVGRAGADPRAYLVASGCYRIFRALGVDGAMGAHAQPVFEVSAAGPAGGIAFLAEDRSGGASEPLGYMIEAVRITDVLEQAVAQVPSITRMSSAAVSALEFGPGFATIETAAGQAISRLVVGCDGLRSSVRQAAGIRYEGRDYRAKAISAFMEAPDPHDGVARQVFLKTGPIAALPMTDGRLNLVWSVDAAVADALLAMTDAEFEAELAHQAPGFVPGARLVSPRAAFQAGVHVADRFHGHRVALAGDSAHQVHPLAGQGFNLGLKDMAALADVVGDALRVGLDIGSEAALAPYTRWRRTDITATAAAMDAFLMTFTSPAPVRAVASLAMQLVGSSREARTFFAGIAGAESGDLPSLMRDPEAA